MLILKLKWQRFVDDEKRTCPRCSGTEEELDRAYLKLREALSPLGIEVVLEKKELTLEEFKANPLASNQLWIGDKTLEEWLGAMTGKSRCCDVCGDNECRTVKIRDKVYETIPASMIIKAGLMAAAEMLPLKIQTKHLCRQVATKEHENVIARALALSNLKDEIPRSARNDIFRADYEKFLKRHSYFVTLNEVKGLFFLEILRSAQNDEKETQTVYKAFGLTLLYLSSSIKN